MRAGLVVALLLCLSCLLTVYAQSDQPDEGHLSEEVFEEEEEMHPDWSDHTPSQEGEMSSDTPDDPSSHPPLLDPPHYQVNIHFTKSSEHSTEQEVLRVAYNSVPFQCATASMDNSLPSLFANATFSSSFPPYDERQSPLSTKQMQGLSSHFQVLTKRCYFDLATTLGHDYIYQTCFFPGSLKRGNVMVVERDDHTGVTQMTWDDVVSLANATEADRNWWGFVENDPVALDRTGYSSYFYQYFGENVIVQYHCAQRVKYLAVDEPSRGKFVVVYGTPLACTHPFIQRVRSHPSSVDCYLDADAPTGSKTEIEGPWKIFDSGDQLYHGSVEMTKFSYFDWPDPQVAYPDREVPFSLADPQMYFLQWELSGGDAYSGIGIEIDHNLCVGWSPHDVMDGPGISVFRKGSSRFMDGYWWSSTGYGLEEMTRLPKANSKTDAFSGSYALLRTVDTEGESTTYYGSAVVEYQTHLDSYTILWSTKGLGSFVGHGVANGDQMCVIWRKRRKTNDGVVNYLMEGDRAHGRWGLSVGAQRTQTEDLIRASSL